MRSRPRKLLAGVWYRRDPAAAVLHVPGDPEVAGQALVVELDGGSSPYAVLSFDEGERVVRQLSTRPGDHVLTALDGACEVNIVAPEGVGTDVLLEQRECDCSLAVVGQRPPGRPDHLFGSIAARATAGAAVAGVPVVVRSLDQPPNPVPVAARFDEGGLVLFDTVAPGRYGVTAKVDRLVVASAETEGESDRGAQVTLEFDLPTR